jgi:hypothetical protein
MTDQTPVVNSSPMSPTNPTGTFIESPAQALVKPGDFENPLDTTTGPVTPPNSQTTTTPPNTGTTTTTQNNTQTTPQTTQTTNTNPPATPIIPPGIDPTTTEGQAQWYSQDPSGFDAYAVSQGMSEVSKDQTALTASQKQLTDLQAQGNNIVTEYLNGAFPLSNTQQASVSSLQASWNAVIAAQEDANQSYVNAAGMSAMRSGGQYNPTGFAQSAQRAIQEGLSKVTSLQAESSDAVNKLQQSYQDEDYNAIQKNYDSMIAIDSKISDSIQTALTAAQKSVDDAKADKQASDKLALDKIVEDDTKNYQKKMSDIAQSNATETQRHDAAEEVIENETASNGNYSEDSFGNILDKRTGAVVGSAFGGVSGGTYTGTDENGNSVTPGHTGNTTLDENTTVSASGIPFIDGTNIDAKLQTPSQLAAAKLGIPFLTSKSASAINLVSAATYNVRNIQADAKTILPTDAQGRITGAADRLISQQLQTDDERASWGAWRAAAIKSIQAIAAGGTGLRINQAEIALAVTQDIPTINDKIGVASAKLAKLQSMLQNTETPLFGGQDKYNWMKSASAPDPLTVYASASPDYGKLVVAALKKYPNYTNSQIMQVLPGDVSNWSFPINNQVNTNAGQ